jgi:hypothetical protein
MTDWRYKTFRNLTLTVVICLLVLNTISFGKPDPHRFDPFLKTYWYGLYARGMKAGYAKIVLEKADTPISGWRQEEEITCVVNIGGEEFRRVNTSSRTYKSPSGELVAVELDFHSNTGDFKVKGQTEGDSFIFKITLEGQEMRKYFNRPIDFLDSNLVAAMTILSGKAVVGDSIGYTHFITTTPDFHKSHHFIKFLDKSVDTLNGALSTIYTICAYVNRADSTYIYKMDSNGNPIEITTDRIVQYKLEDETTAKNCDLLLDFDKANLIKPDKEIGPIDSLKTLTLLINGIDSTMLPSTPTQQVRRIGDDFELVLKTQEPPKNPPNIPIEKKEEFLKSTPFIQSDNLQIIKLAREIAAGEKNSWEVAKRINSWVYFNMIKQNTPTISTSLQILDSRIGDCDDHATLAVALLRASGIPARKVLGIVYVRSTAVFAYHAWVEAYLGHWVQMDPMWNDDLADLTHISLVRDNSLGIGPIVQMQIADKMKIKVMETR